MKLFSIKDLEQLSGVKAHTIRIWEQRFKLFTPQRTATNLRLYGKEDLCHLLNVSLLIKNGYRISVLASLIPVDVAKKVTLLKNAEDRHHAAIHELIKYKYTSQPEMFKAVLDTSVEHWGLHTTIEQVIIPFLEKTGLLSYGDKSYETHLVVTAIRRKLILALETARPAVINNNLTALLFLPHGEHFDLILLYMAYVLLLKGIKVFYLGTNVPDEQLKELIADRKPELLYTYLPAGTKHNLTDLSAFIKEHSANTRLFVTGYNHLQRGVNTMQLTYITVKDIPKTVVSDQSL